jgi:hypothetical protein
VSDRLKNPDRHREPGVLARPSPELRDEAKQLLADAGWTMNEFLIAALVLLTKNTKPFLGHLDEFRPERRKGRPRKS